jgi:branched-chain amino acid transport system substrate-binding protein
MKIHIVLLMSILFFSSISMANDKNIILGLSSNFSEVSTSTSNPYGNYFRDGVALALKDSDQELRAAKIKVQIQEFNYEISPMKAVEAAEEAGKSQAIAVIGYNWSSHALLAAPVHQKYKLPMITPSATADRLGKMSPYVHLACFDNSYMAKTMATFARTRLKAKTAAMIVSSDCAYCRDLANAFASAFKSSGGNITLDLSILSSDQNFDKTAKSVADSQPDVIFVPNQEFVSARVILALLNQGVNKPFLGGDGWGDVGGQFFQVLGDNKLEAYSVSHWHPDLPNKLSKAFIERYKKTFNKDPNDTAVLAYDATKLFIRALIMSPQKDRKGIEHALSKVKEFVGIAGKFKFKDGKAPEKSIVLLKNGKNRFEVVGQISPQ